MNNIQDQRYGITGPVSFKESSPEDIKLTEAMNDFLKDSQFFESEDAGQTRERVLGKLDFMLKKFVDETAPRPNPGRDYGGKIFTFGSYRLGVHDRGADIDVLCVVPRHVQRRDFFTLFYDSLSQDPSVSELSKVEEAYAPLIKLKFHGIPIDMTFARVNVPVVKDISLLHDVILKSMDEKCITSLNGSRVTDAMLHLVPKVGEFHSALRAIKFWAKRRHIYGNTYGYLGGVAYSISVARICQMFPNASAYEIVCRYFEIFSTWKWPAPVQLCPIVDCKYFNMKVWDPKVNPADKYHRMPILTPVYPARCATHNVTQSTFNVMAGELARGWEMTKTKASFATLFKTSNFFQKHKMFVEIAISTENEESFGVWQGFVESKVRILGTKLEGLDCISAAVPFPRSFTEGRPEGPDPSSDEFKEGESEETAVQDSKVLFKDKETEEFKMEDHPRQGLSGINQSIINNHPESKVEDHPRPGLGDINGHPESKMEDHLRQGLGDINQSIINNHPESKVEDHPRPGLGDINGLPESKVEDHPRPGLGDINGLPESKVEDHSRPGLGDINGHPESKMEDHLRQGLADINQSIINNHLESKMEVHPRPGLADTTVTNLLVNEQPIKKYKKAPFIVKPPLFSAWFYIGIDVVISQGASRKFYIGDPIVEFLNFLNLWEFRKADMKIEITPKKKKDVLNLPFIKEMATEE